MFSHLSLSPSPANSQADPPFLEDVGRKLSGNIGTLLDDTMPKSKSRAEAVRTGSTSSNDVSIGEGRNEKSFSRSAEMHATSEKEPGKVRAFDPITETGMIMANGSTFHGAIPFDTEGMTAELVQALQDGERGMDILFKATTVDDEWMATDIEQVSPAKYQGSRGTGRTCGKFSAWFQFTTNVFIDTKGRPAQR
jgi:hypothetical protein